MVVTVVVSARVVASVDGTITLVRLRMRVVVGGVVVVGVNDTYVPQCCKSTNVCMIIVDVPSGR